MSVTPFQALACPLDGVPSDYTGSAWKKIKGARVELILDKEIIRTWPL
jgi:hypothetical protein